MILLRSMLRHLTLTCISKTKSHLRFDIFNKESHYAELVYEFPCIMRIQNPQIRLDAFMTFQAENFSSNSYGISPGSSEIGINASFGTAVLLLGKKKFLSCVMYICIK
jgi:hypothetical protein